jgi:SPP1 gp7 family putative phage head morphogenesis protein
MSCNCGEEAATLAAETQNQTDLRRARQRARRVTRELEDEITEFIENNEAGLSDLASDEAKRRQINRRVTLLSNDKFREDLLSWLDERRKATMGRSARAAMSRMQTELGVDAEDLRGVARFSNEDRATAEALRNIDVGLIKEVAEETGDRLTEQIARGFANGETTKQIGRRVDAVLVDAGIEDRPKLGVKGQTIRSKGEMIAHDSIQDAYETTARERYLRNGFKFARYDAILDKKTSAICRRLNGEIIDLREQGHLRPPLHPWCRSDLIPVRKPETAAVNEANVADEHLEKAMQTKSYRPDVLDANEVFSPSEIAAMSPTEFLEKARSL